MRKSLAGFACCATAVLLLLFPPAFLYSARNRVLQNWLTGGRLAYTGNLSVWVVDAKADGKQALTDWLRGRAAFYEKNHFGVYPDIQGPMTMDSVLASLLKGERPDVLLCGADVPSGVLDAAAPFEGPFLMPKILPQYYGDKLTPVLQSGTLILLNEDALYRAGLSPPAGLENMDAQWVSDFLTALPDAIGYEDGTALMAAVTGQMPDDLRQALLKGKRSTVDSFLSGATAVYLTSQNALWELYKQDLLGKTLPGIIALPLSGFASRVECAVLIQNDDKSRQLAAEAFITTLLGKQAQTALSDIYALPVVQGTSCARADLSALWQNAECTVYVYAGLGEASFLDKVANGTAPDELKSFVISLCLPP